MKHPYPKWPLNYKPLGWALSPFAPYHDWVAVSAPGWATCMQQNHRARALLSLLWHTQAVGFCGKVDAVNHPDENRTK